MLKGQIYITCDESVVMNSLYNSKVIIIGEIDQEFVRRTGAIPASIFLPPYQAASLFIEGDMTGYTQSYLQYLTNKEPSTYIALILRTLMEGNNILLYLTQDEAEMKYADILLSYLFENFGVCVGTPMHPYSYNPAYNTKVCDIMYYFGLMNAQELFVNYTEPLLNPNLIPLLIQEMHPYMGQNINPTIEDYAAYFNNYLQAVKRNNNTFLINPISKE